MMNWLFGRVTFLNRFDLFATALWSYYCGHHEYNWQIFIGLIVILIISAIGEMILERRS